MTAPPDQVGMRARHIKAVCHPGHGSDYCKECLAVWPCDAIQALDALGEAERDAEQWRHECARCIQECSDAYLKRDRFSEALTNAEKTLAKAQRDFAAMRAQWLESHP